jgi:hypothetical protein
MAKLFVILARNPRDAVIFRRGPSKQVLLIKWDRKSDSFEIGQWFKGRIYEDRCDLSPSGNLLVYLAAKHRGPIPTWTAVSKPPYLTAVALWPNLGTWGGGGLFDDEHSLRLSHIFDDVKLAEGFALSKSVKVSSLGNRSGAEAINSIHHIRLLRDGWHLHPEGTLVAVKSKKPAASRMARIYEREMVGKKSTHILRMKIHGAVVGDDKYAPDYEVLDRRRNSVLSLPRLDWADWDDNGDLLFTKAGKLFRLAAGRNAENWAKPAKELADFSALTFAEKKAPKWAQHWGVAADATRAKPSTRRASPPRTVR